MKFLRIASFLVLFGYLAVGIIFSSTAQEVDAGIDRPAEIAIDSENGKIYVSNIFSARVIRANLDGSGSEILVCNFRCAGQVSQILSFNHPDGIALDLDNNTLYWTDPLGARIWQSDLNGSNANSLICAIECEGGVEYEDISEPLAIAVDSDGGKIYWTDGGEDTLERANLDGTEIETILCTTGCPNRVEIEFVDRAAAMTIDVTGQKIYWVNSLSARVLGANLDGTASENIICKDECEGGALLPTLVRPAGVAVDVANGKIYWSDEVRSVIQRANLDGSEIENVLCAEACDGGTVSGDLDSPGGIALDLDAGKLYWVDEDADLVGRVNLDGSGSEIILCRAC